MTYHKQYHQNKKPLYEVGGINGAERIKGWVQNRIDKETIKFADGFGKELSKGFTTSQIRKIFGEVKRIQMHGWKGDSTESEILVLKARLAYAAKRAGGKAIAFKKVISAGIDAIVDSNDKPKSLENFVLVFESILAYHKSHGGK